MFYYLKEEKKKGNIPKFNLFKPQALLGSDVSLNGIDVWIQYVPP